jgi:hypothetical protein
MLKHEANAGQDGQYRASHSAPNAPAAEADSASAAAAARATPDEISQALAAIEARRMQAQRFDQETVPIGEVVSQLGLEVSPDEVLAEVEARRRASAEGGQERRQAEGAARQAASVDAVRVRRSRAVLAAAGLAGIVFFMLGLGTVRSVSVPAPPLTAPVAVSEGGSVSTVNPGTLVQDRGPDGGTILRTLSEVPDGRMVRATLTTSNTLRGTFLTLQDYAEEGGRGGWRVVKHGDSIYVRGWIPRTSDAALPGRSIVLYNDPGQVGEGVTPLPVTVPMDALRVADDQHGMRQAGYLLIESIQTDGHLHDAWWPSGGRAAANPK